MGELLSKEMLGDLAINIINIIILFIVTKKLLYKPVKKMLDARKEKIATAQAQADEIKAEAMKSKAEYDELCRDAENTKNMIIGQARKQAEKTADEIVAAAENDAREIIIKANSDAEKAKQKATEQAQDEIADIAVAIASKILARECTDDDNRKVIDSFFSGNGAE